MKILKSALVCATVSLVACGAGSPDGESNAHSMSVDRPGSVRETTAALSAPHLTYHGGAVLDRAKIVTVYWGSNVNYRSQLDGFYATVANSTYFDMLSEYSLATAPIGRGILNGPILDTGAPPGTSITDAQIAGELGRLIDAGTLSRPDLDTVYMVHFPPGVTITMPNGSKSCQDICAYHSLFVHNGAIGFYGVIPDQGGSCAGGCGLDPTPFNNLTSVASHELVEIVTDPSPGASWYDQTLNEEIADICLAQQGSAAGYVVQRQWSNANGACRVAGGATPNPIDDSNLFVTQMYRDILERTPDAGGFAFWIAQLQACNGSSACLDSTRTGVARTIFESPEHQQMHPELNPASSTYKSAYVTNAYTSFLRRQPSSAELNYWMGGLTSTGDFGAVIHGVITSSEYRARFL